MVSIHALLAECDPYRLPQHKVIHSFNPRTPCGVRLDFNPPFYVPTMFQSTHSLRSATRRSFSGSDAQSVSIHALLAECDFYRICHAEQRPVSIHALLAECDQYVLADWRGGKSFNPRTPCGVRHVSRHASSMASRFQSTHSLRSATSLSSSWQRQFEVSIHALLAECDISLLNNMSTNKEFQSTHSLRSATEEAIEKSDIALVSIHALLAECDRNPKSLLRRLKSLFQSTHSLRSATQAIT